MLRMDKRANARCVSVMTWTLNRHLRFAGLAIFDSFIYFSSDVNKEANKCDDV